MIKISKTQQNRMPNRAGKPKHFNQIENYRATARHFRKVKIKFDKLAAKPKPITK